MARLCTATITTYKECDDVYNVHLVEEYDIWYSSLTRNSYCATIAEAIVEHGIYSFQSSIDGQRTILNIPRDSYDRIDIRCVSIEDVEQFD